jgi:hypothetical protein
MAPYLMVERQSAVILKSDCCVVDQNVESSVSFLQECCKLFNRLFVINVQLAATLSNYVATSLTVGAYKRDFDRRSFEA